MKREVVNNLNERDFVTSIIMSDKCCQVLIPFIKLQYFECDYTRVIVQWVIEYYKKFKMSPKRDVMSLYRVHCDEIQDDSLKDLILTYLQKLSETNINNEDYLLDQSRDFLDYRALTNYTEDLKACLNTRSMEKAREIQSGYRKVSVAETNEVSLLSLDDTNIIKEALEKVDEELFTLPDAYSEVVGKIHRNDFIAILAGMKKGKSWALGDLALRAMKQQLNVVFVSMEMTREEVVQRFWKMLFGAKSGLIQPGLVETSRFVEDLNEPEKYKVELIDVNVKEGVGKSVEELQKQLRAQNNYMGNLRIVAYPAFSVSATEVEQRVEELAQNGFIADVVVIDYADILKPCGGGSELRNQLDATWKALRAFAMKFHCCVITASQTNRAGLNSSIIDATVISDDIRKACHVTSFVALEQTPKMKKQHLMRVHNIMLRQGTSGNSCVFPQALGLGQFIFQNPIKASQLNLDDDCDDDLSVN